MRPKYRYFVGDSEIPAMNAKTYRTGVVKRIMNANDLQGCLNQAKTVALIPLCSTGVVNLKWYTYHQNNSGGSFDIDRDVDQKVIIQASSASEADDLAQRIGIYFNGVDDGIDCDCCGDRWYPSSWNDEGTNEPEVYGEVVVWSPDMVTTTGHVKVYPYSVINNR